MLRDKIVPTILVAIVVVCFPTAAHAMRIVSLSIQVDGKPYMSGQTGDNGGIPNAIVWRYFSHILLRPNPGAVIAPDPNDSKRATLKGKIKLEARYGGTAEVDELHLVRTDITKDEWTVEPGDVQKIAETIGLGSVPVVLPDRPMGNLEGQREGDTEREFPWIWVIGVGVVIVALAGIGFVLLLRGKMKSEPEA